MILSMASYSKSWFERTTIDFVPINQSQPQNANSIYIAGMFRRTLFAEVFSR